MPDRPAMREDDRRLLQSSARDADEHRRMCTAYMLGFYAASNAVIDAIAAVRSPTMPAYEREEEAA